MAENLKAVRVAKRRVEPITCRRRVRKFGRFERSEQKTLLASGVRIPVRRDSLLAKRASEGEGREGSLAKRAVCARVEKKIVTSPRSLDPIYSDSKKFARS